MSVTCRGRLTAAHWLVIGVSGLLLLVFAPALVRGSSARR